MKRLQSTAKTFAIFDKKTGQAAANSESKATTSAKNGKNQKQAGTKKPASSGFGFLSLEQSMNDKTLQVYKDKEFVCIRDKYPKSRVHLLLIPLPAASNDVKLTKVEQLIQLPKSIEFLKKCQEICEKIITTSICDKPGKFPTAEDLMIGKMILM